MFCTLAPILDRTRVGVAIITAAREACLSAGTFFIFHSKLPKRTKSRRARRGRIRSRTGPSGSALIWGIPHAADSATRLSGPMVTAECLFIGHHGVHDTSKANGAFIVPSILTAASAFRALKLSHGSLQYFLTARIRSIEPLVAVVGFLHALFEIKLVLGDLDKLFVG